VPGFLLGCPLQTGGSIASTGTSALFHPQLVRTGLTIKTFIARETRTFARRAFASCIVTVRKTIACQLNRLALGVLMPMRHSSCWRSQGSPSNKNPPHNWPVRRGRLLNMLKRILYAAALIEAVPYCSRGADDGLPVAGHRARSTACRRQGADSGAGGCAEIGQGRCLVWPGGRCAPLRASYDSAGGSEGGSLTARPLGGRGLECVFPPCCDFSPATGKVTGLFHLAWPWPGFGTALRFEGSVERCSTTASRGSVRC
jgi:hypothetical protein